MPEKISPTARKEFLELIQDLCELVPDENLGRLEQAVRKLLPPEVEAELEQKLGRKEPEE